MKKLGLILLGGVAAIVLLANLGPMIALAISLVILYFVVKEFLKAQSALSKILWAIIGVVILSISISNVPAVIGVVAAYVLYVVYKKWKRADKGITKEDNDPFTNFEKEWSEMKRTI